MSAPSIDGRAFRLVTSTASAVDQRATTRFVYHERDGMVWAEYSGGIALEGRMVGRREGDRLRLHYVHLLRDGRPPVSGTAESAIAVAEDGRLRLTEDFDVDEVPHRSICIEDRGEAE